MYKPQKTWKMFVLAGGAIINAKSFLTSWWGGKDATNDSPTHSVDSNTGL